MENKNVMQNNFLRKTQPKYQARQGKARQGKARQGKARIIS